jgi:hypothetical protein
VDERRVTSGEPIALIGGTHDALRAWAQLIGPERRVLDLQGGAYRPSVSVVRKVFAGAHGVIVLAGRPEQVVRALGLEHQTYMVAAVSLRARPDDALVLLQAAIDELTPVPLPFDALGQRAEQLRAYDWPRGLAEIRATAWVATALLMTEGNLTAAASKIGVTRQALQRWFVRRR